MRLDFSKERVLAVVAHPDDCELLCAGTLARARDDGAPIGLCVMCQGEKGQGSAGHGNLAEVRRKELEAATAILGAELLRCEFGDGTLFDSEDQRRTLIEVFRVFRPTLVLAHAPNDYHPDHRAASALAEAASWFCASRGHRTKSPPLD
ncbi:MAG TPA: LmbE family protein, partial [Planctomycetaceae bacterium]|nr:LmbE family protein [Planctomycetaceae bacterium]